MELELFDTHCHLNDVEAFPDPAPIVEEARQAGVGRMTVIGVDGASSQYAIKLAEEFEGVYASIGWHPNYTTDFTEEAFEQLMPLFDHPKVVALGEVGLDNHWDYSSKEQQLRALVVQLAFARERNIPVVFHCREAEEELLAVLETNPVKCGVLHCFGGDKSQALRALDLGLYLGVDGPITYKKNELLREIFAEAPMDRILIETDAPWLAPIPHRGKQNRPAYVRVVADTLATARGMSLPDVARATTANALRFYRIQNS